MIKQEIAEPAVLRMERTEEEKRRRSQHGDAGAQFSGSKNLKPRPDGISNTLTGVQKDNLLQEAIKVKQATAQGYVECPVGGVLTSPTRQANSEEGECRTMEIPLERLPATTTTIASTSANN